MEQKQATHQEKKYFASHKSVIKIIYMKSILLYFLVHTVNKLRCCSILFQLLIFHLIFHSCCPKACLDLYKFIASVGQDTKHELDKTATSLSITQKS